MHHSDDRWVRAHRTERKHYRKQSEELDSIGPVPAIELPVTVARGAPPQQVIDVLKRVAASQSGITKEPAPQAYVVNFGSAAVSFNLRVWTDQYEDWIQMRSNLAVAVDEALAHENIAVA
jgi:potassium-dependent mechanosensitive channel